MEEKLKKRTGCTGCTCDLCRSEPDKRKPKPWWETEYDAVRKRQDEDEQEDFDAERDYLKRWNPGDYWC